MQALPLTQTQQLHELHERSAHPGLSRGTPSAPLFGVLPLARWVPQDVHSVADYGHAVAAGGVAILTRNPTAIAASIALGGSALAVSALTDYRLSLAKLIPIERHEAIDHLWGIAAVLAPFVLGYWKTAPKVAVTHVSVGIGSILWALVTDYRAYRNVGRRRMRVLEG